MITLSYILMTVLMFLGLFLIALILLQRGRGGGLAGAFGGLGGQSALGTKAGDVFTRVTIGVATAWILLCAINVIVLHNSVGNKSDESIFKREDQADVKKAEPKAEDDLTIPKAPANPAEDGTIVPPTGEKPETEAPKDKQPEEKKSEEKPTDQAQPEAPNPNKPAEPSDDEKKPAPPKTEPSTDPKPQ